MKIVVLGDIHGRLIWNDILEAEENIDLVIFLGDYVSTHDEEVTSEQQLANLEDILEHKRDNMDKIILLRGNHDIQHMGYPWAKCSGFDAEVMKNFPKETFTELTQWCHIMNLPVKFNGEVTERQIIFSHAGISAKWLENNELCINEINDLPIDERWKFTPDNFNDWSGESISQPPTWIRPASLAASWPEGNPIQIVGHTGYGKIFKPEFHSPLDKIDLFLCDALEQKQYLVYEDGVITAREIG